MCAVVSIIPLLISLSDAGTFNNVSYYAPPLTSAECASSLLQAIPPIRLDIIHWRDTKLDGFVLDNSIAAISEDGNYHSDLVVFRACS